MPRLNDTQIKMLECLASGHIVIQMNKEIE